MLRPPIGCLFVKPQEGLTYQFDTKMVNGVGKWQTPRLPGVLDPPALFTWCRTTAEDEVDYEDGISNRDCAVTISIGCK